MRRIICDVTKGRVKFVYQDIREFDYHGSLCRDVNGQGIDEATWKQVHEHFSEPAVILGIDPIPGALEAIGALGGEFEIHFVTTRRPKARAATIEWLDRQGMARRNSYSLHFVAHRQKHDVLSNMSASIDDDLLQAVLFAKSGVRSILLAHPWNQTSDTSVERARSWNDIVELLTSDRVA